MRNLFKYTLTLFVCVLMYETSYAQQFSVAPVNTAFNNEITVATQIEAFTLTLSSITTSGGTYRLSLASAGLYVNLSSNSSNLTVSPLPATRDYIDFTINSTTFNTASLVFTLEAGACFVIPSGTQELQVPSIFKINSSSSAVTGNPSIKIKASGYLVPAFSENQVFKNSVFQSSGSDMILTAVIGDNASRDWHLKNTSSKTFSGEIYFAQTATSTTVAIQSIELYLYNPAGTYPGTLITQTTGTSLAYTTSVSSTFSIIIRENVTVIGCLDNNAGITNREINWGNGAYETCNKITDLNPNITRSNDKAHISVVESESNYRSDISCKGNTAIPKHIVIINDGTAVAHAVKLELVTAYQRYAVPKSSVKIALIRNGIKTYYDIDDTKNLLQSTGSTTPGMISWNTVDPALLADPGVASIFQQTLDPNHPDAEANILGVASRFVGNGRGDAMFTCISTMTDVFAKLVNGAPPYIGSCLPNLDNTEIVVGYVFSHLKDVSGNSFPIELLPGDKVEIDWDEYNCCYNAYVPVNEINSSNLNWKFKNDCGVYSDFATSGNIVSFRQGMSLLPEAGSNNLSADPDRCTSNTDGQIEDVTFTVTLPGGFAQDAQMDNFNGKIYFKIFLEDGLDLDLGLERPKDLGYTTYYGFNNINNETLCNSNCGNNGSNVCNTPGELPHETYRVSFIPYHGTEIHLDTKVTRVASHGDGSDQDRLLFRPDPYHSSVAKQGYYLYYVEMDLNELVQNNDMVPAPGENPATTIYNFLKGGQFKAKVRSYCPAAKGPGEDPKTSMQIQVQYDKCSTPVGTSDYCNVPMYTSMMPLSFISYSYQINCPGCRVPGTNINGGTLLRVNLGEKDDDDDGFPDGTGNVLSTDPLARLATNGDVMRASYVVVMSDGESGTLGCTKGELDNNGYYLDNLILQVATTEGVIEYVPNTARVKLGNGTFSTTNIHFLGYDNVDPTQAKMCYFQVKADEIGSYITVPGVTNPVPSFHIGLGYDVTFEADVRISQVGGNVHLVDVNFLSGYTPCENCFNTYTPISPNLAGTSTSLSTILTTPNAYIWCTNSGTNFKFIPYYSEHRTELQDAFGENSCLKVIPMKNWGQFSNGGSIDMFQGEYRYFYTPNVPMKEEVAIPAGYSIDHIQITHTGYSQYGYSMNLTYTITPAQFNTYLTSARATGQSSMYFTTNAHGDQVVGFNIFYRPETLADKSSYIANSNGNFYYYQNYNVFPDQLQVKDEYWVTQIDVIVGKTQSGCISSLQEAVPNDYSVTNLPSNLLTMHPKTTKDHLSDNPNLLSSMTNTFGYYNEISGGSSTTTLHTDGTTQLNFSPVNVGLQLSNTIGQSLLINGNSRSLGINIKNTSSTISANYPFLIIEGTALDPAKGLTLDGLYNSTSQKITGYGVIEETFQRIDGTTGRRIIINFNRQDWWDATASSTAIPSIPAMSQSDQGYNYNLVFNYTCSSAVDQGCGIGNVPDASSLSIKAGTGCYEYPDFTEFDAHHYCGLSTQIDYSITPSPYGTLANATVTTQGQTFDGPSSFTVPNCDQADYTLKLKSCQSGEVTGYDVTFTKIPAGLTLGSTYIVTNAPGTTVAVTVTQDGTNPNLYHITANTPADYMNYGEEIYITWKLNADCSFEGGLLEVFYTAKAACGQNLSSSDLVNKLAYTINASPFTNPVVDDITIDQVSCCGNNVVISYTINSAIAHDNILTVTLPAGVTDNQGYNVVTYTIPDNASTGVNTFTVNLATPASTSGSVATITQYATYTCSSSGVTCERVGNLLQAQCSGASTTLTLSSSSVCASNAQLTATANPSGTYTYNWYKNGTTVGQSTDGTWNTAGVAGTYTVSVDNNGCLFYSNPVTIYPNPDVYLTVAGDDGASFLCLDNTTVELTAHGSGGTGALSYSWTGAGLNTTTGTVVTVSQPGTVTVMVTDDHCSSSVSHTVSNSVVPLTPDPVCPGGSPVLSIPNLNGTVGTYHAGWFLAGSSNPTLIDNILVEGDYYAVAISEACTLKTVAPLHISFKPAPAAFHVTPDNYVFACPTDVHTISITNKDANDRNNDGDYYNDGVTYLWSNGNTNLNDIVATGWGSWSIDAMDNVSMCVTHSNKATITGPQLHISRSCTGTTGEVLLTASANFTTGAYHWWTLDLTNQTRTEITDPLILSNGGASITVTQVGVYAVTNDNSTCLNTEAIAYENLVTTASPNADLLSDTDGRFDNLVTCTDAHTFTSNLGCIDRSYYTPGNPNYVTPGPAVYGNLLPGNFMINQGMLTANSWNPGLWQGLGYNNSPNFMIVDGADVLSDQVIWSMDVPSITAGNYYLFRAMVRNVSGFASSVPEEMPELFLRITYNNGGESYQESRQILYKNTNTQWIEVTEFTPARGFVNNNQIVTPTHATIEIVLGAGNVVGRDLAIDNVTFMPVGLCDDLQTILNTTGRNCGSVASVDFYEKATCAGGSITFNVFDLATDSQLQYNWTTLGSTSLIQNTRQFTVSPTQTTSYTLTVYNPGMNCSFTQNVTAIILNSTGSVNAGTDKSVCAGGTVQVSATGASSYSWSPSAGVSNPNSANPVITPTVTTTYTVTGLNVDGCASTDQVVVTVNDLPTVNAGADVGLCAGSSTNLLASGSATSYSWSPSTGLSSTNTAATTASPATPVTYTVTATTANGCISTDQVYVYVISPPVVSAGPDKTICAGSSVTLAGSSQTNYTWSPSTGLSATDIYNPVASPSSTTTYTLTGSSTISVFGVPLTCSSTDQVVVTVNPLPTVSNPGANACYGSTYNFPYATATNAVSYSWSPATNLSSTNVLHPVLSVPTSGTSLVAYTLTVTSAEGCQASSTSYMNYRSVPILNAGADVSICSGSSTTITATTSESQPQYSQFSWSPTTGVGSPTSISSIFNPTTTTTYTLTTTSPFGCVSSDQVIVTVKSLPTVSAGADVVRCYNGSTSTLTATGATSYVWSPSTYLSSTTTATTNVGPGPINGITYTVTGTGANGCTNTDQVYVYLSSPPAVSAGSDKSICPGGSVTLNGSSPVGNYSWSPSTGLSATNVASPTSNPSATTTYTLTTTGTMTVAGVTFSCVVSDQVVVEIVPTPSITMPGSGMTMTANVGSLPAGVTITNYKWEYRNNTSGAFTTSCNSATSTTCNFSILPQKRYWQLTVTYSTSGGTCSITSAVSAAFRAAAQPGWAEEPAGEIVVYPVPVSNLLNIEYNSDTILQNMVMYDALGKEVLRKEINANVTELDVHHIPAGVYIIHFIDGRNVMHTRRVEIIH